MNIRDIPATYETLEGFNADFERRHFGYTEAGSRVALAMVEMFVGKIPGLPLRLGLRGVCALLDDPLIAALGLPHPTSAERRAVEGGLKLRARVVRALPPRRKPRLRTELRRRTYPQGYRVEELGPAGP
jgi:hypothetical protein